MKTIDGFDYVLMKPVSRTRSEWRELLAKAKGSFSQKHGETFVYGPAQQMENGYVFHTLLAEIYEQGVLR